MNDIERGTHAKAVLDNPVYQCAFDGIKYDLYTRWLASESVQDRETYFLSTKVLDKLEAALRYAMVNGDIELKNLEHKQKRSLKERIGF